MRGELEPLREFVLSYARSSFEILETLYASKNVMFEGAQGALLDISYGTFPFVTSSNTIAGQVSIGGCVGSNFLDKTIGVVKAYTTRVGSGFFPTELDDEIGEFLRSEGREFGTVTGRKRRCGWFDAALINQSLKMSSVKEIALTKLDVLDKLERIKICVGYRVDGKVYNHLPLQQYLWSKIEPVYEEFDGWQQTTAGANSLELLPPKARKYIERIEELCHVKAIIISTGANRNHTIETNA